MTTLGLTILFAVIVAFGALVGLCRGLNKSVIRLMTLVLAVLLTFLVAAPVTRAIAENVKIEGLTLGEMVLESIAGDAMIAGILNAAPLMKEAILVAPAFAMGIVVFPVAFLLLRFITWIVILFVQKPLRKVIFKDNCNKAEYKAQPKGMRMAQRFGGLGVGAVCGVLIFAMVMTPMLGLFTVLPDKSATDAALDAMVQQNILSQEDVNLLKEEYGVTDSGLVKFFRLMGLTSAGRAYLDNVSKIEADGYKSSLTHEIGSLMGVFQVAMESGAVNALLSPEDPNALYNMLGNKEIVDALMQEMFSSKLLCAAVPEVMAMAMETVAGTMGVPADKNAVYNNMMDDVAQAVQNADVDFAAIEAYEKAHGLAGNFARSSRKGSSSDVMTEEEYEAQIQKLVKLASAISSIINTAVSGDNLEFTDSIADLIVNEVKTQAAQNGADSLANFDAGSVQSAISNADTSALDAGLLEQLTDSEKFTTDVATVQTITESIRASVKNAVADETKASETASTLASVVSDFAGAVSAAVDENGNLDATKLDFEKIGSAVSSLQNSNLKDVGSSVLDIVASGDLGSNELLSNALGAMKEGYENGEDIGGAIGSAGALINLGTAMGGDTSTEDGQEAVVNSLTSLINNLNEFTIGLLPSILSPDTLASMGIPAEFADAAFSVVETLLTELMNLKGADDYENEVNAILSLYNLVTNGMENFTEDDIGKLVNYAVESDAIFNTLKSISTSNPFGIEIGDKQAQKDVANAIEDCYEQSGKTDREKEIFYAVATLLGVEERVDLD
jgi:uncharacterized membrane protein required for colicin V production